MKYKSMKGRFFKYCKKCNSKFHPKGKYTYVCDKCKNLWHHFRLQDEENNKWIGKTNRTKEDFKRSLLKGVKILKWGSLK